VPPVAPRAKRAPPARTTGDTRGLAALDPRHPPRGRGAGLNPSGRYESLYREAFDDGWAPEPDAAPPPATELIAERARSIISYNTSPDLSFDRTVNPYRGCEHGCVYCYARPAHAWVGLSPGLDFETRIFFKPDAAALLRQELRAKGYQPATLVLGGNTDVYQPAERTHGLTRACLQVLAEARHPVALVTKSALVLRDLDLLAPLAAEGLAKVAVSLTTLAPTLARRMEPRAAAPHRRLETIRALAAAGVPVTVMTAPLIPAINDTEIERLLEAAADAGASAAGYVMLRVPLEIEALVRDWLARHYPTKADHVFSLLRGLHEGATYRSEFGVRQRGTGAYARLIADRFRTACRRLGLSRARTGLRTDLFRPPAENTNQGELFG